MNFIEKSYNQFLRISFAILNPLKKSVIKTQCKVHIFINNTALLIIKNDGYLKEHALYEEYIDSINEGAVWADQNFKSSSHFYNPYTNKGLYGQPNGKLLSQRYYNLAINLWKANKKEKSMFYLGAAFHILQDMVIPQHANIRLLDNHRQYETFVKKTYRFIKEFKVENGAYILKSFEDYINLNAKCAIKFYEKYKMIKEDELRFYQITKCILPLAQRSTAGCMIIYYKNIIPLAHTRSYFIQQNNVPIK